MGLSHIPNYQKKKMTALYSPTRLRSPSTLQFCHHNTTHFLSLKPPFLSPPRSSAPTQYLSQSLQYTAKNPNLHKPISSPSFKLSITAAAASMSSMPPTDETKPFSVLFVCLGNICRSPAAEGVFTDLVKKRGLDSKFFIDSAGTIGYHEGNQADPRMRASAKRRGIEITSLSRPVKPSDFQNFDLILAMDKQNRDDLMEALERWRFKTTMPADAHKKIKLMCSYCKKHDETEVPDPYYGGQQGFEKVLDLLEDGCESLLDSILAENNHMLS